MSSEPRALRKVPGSLFPGIGSPDNASLPKIDPEALRAKNYPTPGIYELEPGTYMDFSPVRQNMNKTNGPAVTSRIHTGEPIPALAAYQRINKKNSSEFAYTLHILTNPLLRFSNFPGFQFPNPNTLLII